MSLEEKCFSETHSYHPLTKMSQMIMSLLVIVLAILSNANGQMSQPQFTIKAESNKAFDESCLIGNFTIANGNIADCLEHCLENCSCQSFQICQNTQCQLCSSNKKDNTSLLHERNGCVYAMYEMKHLTHILEKMDDHSSGMNCLLKYNCCQQSGLCPKNKICKPVYNITQPWKRFTCECPEGCHGDNCDETIPTSCQGYANGARQSGIYEVAEVANSKYTLYKVHCHFDSQGAWTLVQSYSFANGSLSSKFKDFRKPLSVDSPVNQNVPKWSGYRLNKLRMQSIKNHSVFLRFTCDYEKHHDVEKSDYCEIPLRQYSIHEQKNEKIIDVVESTEVNSNLFVHRGKIGRIQLNNCKIWLRQGNGTKHDIALHILIKRGTTSSCWNPFPFSNPDCFEQVRYFGQYFLKCLDQNHDCVKNDSSTTQIWFGA